MNNPLHIAFVTASLEIGGAERVIKILAEELGALENISVSIFLLTQNPVEFEINDYIKTFKPDFNYKTQIKIISVFNTLHYLRKLIGNQKPDILIAFGSRYNSLAIIAAFGTRIKVYVSERSRPDISQGKFIDLFNFIFYRYAKGIIAQTNSASKILIHRYSNENTFVLPNPVLQFQFNYNKKNYIVNVGRFIKSKQQIKLIEMFNEIDNEGWELHFIGDGPELMPTKEKTNKLGCHNKVIFHGKQKDPLKIVAQSKVFAFTSISEGFPNALLEAFACGTACISFDCLAGPSDIIDDGINGYLIPQDDVVLYKARLAELMNDSKKRELFVGRALEKSKIFHPTQISLNLLNKIYEDCN